MPDVAISVCNALRFFLIAVLAPQSYNSFSCNIAIFSGQRIILTEETVCNAAGCGGADCD
ncbi:MAG: hypothetical protein LBG43_07455 [Treponema sp.]|nr:hypothetical protein [Treponema sp.]